eukprot:g38164.t1
MWKLIFLSALERIMDFPRKGPGPIPASCGSKGSGCCFLVSGNRWPEGEAVYEALGLDWLFMAPWESIIDLSTKGKSFFLSTLSVPLIILCIAVTLPLNLLCSKGNNRTLSKR